MKKPRLRLSRAFADLKALLDEVASGASDSLITSKLEQATSIAYEQLKGATIASVEAKSQGFWASVITAHAHAARLLAENVADVHSLQLFKYTSPFPGGIALSRDPALPTLALAVLRGDALCVYSQILASVRASAAARIVFAADGSITSAGERQNSGSDHTAPPQPPALQRPDAFRLLGITGSVFDAAFALMDAFSADGPDGPQQTELLAALARSGVLEQAAAALLWLEVALGPASRELAAAAAVEAAAEIEAEAAVAAASGVVLDVEAAVATAVEAAAGRAEQVARATLDRSVRMLNTQLCSILQLHTWPPVPAPGRALITESEAAAAETAAGVLGQVQGRVPAPQLCGRLVAGPAVQWLCMSIMQRCGWQPEEQGASKEQQEQQ